MKLYIKFNLILFIALVVILDACKKNGGPDSRKSGGPDFRDSVVGTYKCTNYQEAIFFRMGVGNDSLAYDSVGVTVLNVTKSTINDSAIVINGNTLYYVNNIIYLNFSQINTQYGAFFTRDSMSYTYRNIDYGDADYIYNYAGRKQ